MYDIEHIQEEFIKCYSDKSRIYMIEHYLKTYDATQRKEVQYLLFPKQKELCQALYSGKDIVTLKPRQSGITTTTSSFLACELTLSDPSEPITVLAIGNTLDLAQQFVTKIRDFINQLPRWFFGEKYWSPDEKNPANKEKIFLVSNQKELKLANGSRVIARSSGPDASRGVGGVTYLVFDETAFIENGKDVYTSAVATVSTGGHIILISTPNGKDQLYYETYRQAKLGLNSFSVVEMRWYQDPRYNKHLEWIKKNKDTGDVEVIKEPIIDDLGNIEWNDDHWTKMVNDGWKPRSPWYVDMCKKFNNNEQRIAQELDVSFLGSDSTVISSEFIEMQEVKYVKDPDPHYKDALLDDMWIWKPPYEGHRYVIGVDNSRGDADDFTALEIIDLDGISDDGKPLVEQAAEYYGKLTGDYIGELAYQYGKMYGDAHICVDDGGGYGSSTILTLMNLGYKNLYYDDPNLKKFTSITDATPTPVTQDGLPGFHSNAVRWQMLSLFAAQIKDGSFAIRSKRLLNQLYTWVYTPNGRIDHKDGYHDDAITCCAMVMFVAQFSLNRRMKAMNKDITMLRSMIDVNGRLRYGAEQSPNKLINDRIKTAARSAIVTSNSFSNQHKPSFGANMWKFS